MSGFGVVWTEYLRWGGLARVGLDGYVYMRSVNRMRGKSGNICRRSERGGGRAV